MTIRSNGEWEPLAGEGSAVSGSYTPGRPLAAEIGRLLGPENAREFLPLKAVSTQTMLRLAIERVDQLEEENVRLHAKIRQLQDALDEARADIPHEGDR